MKCAYMKWHKRNNHSTKSTNRRRCKTMYIVANDEFPIQNRWIGIIFFLSNSLYEIILVVFVPWRYKQFQIWIQFNHTGIQTYSKTPNSPTNLVISIIVIIFHAMCVFDSRYSDVALPLRSNHVIWFKQFGFYLSFRLNSGRKKEIDKMKQLYFRSNPNLWFDVCNHKNHSSYVKNWHSVDDLLSCFAAHSQPFTSIERSVLFQH